MTKTNMRKQKVGWLAVLMLIAAASAQAQTVLTADQLQNGQAVELDKLGWKYAPGDDPRFAAPQFDDRGLYYHLNGKMMEVDVSLGTKVEAGLPRELFDTRTIRADISQAWNKTNDEQRFLL